MTKTPSPKKLTPFHIRNKDMGKETATLFIRIHTRKIDVLVSTMLQVEVTDWQKATASPRAWLVHQKKNYQLHAKLTQIEGIIKAHLAKTTFDREALDMDVRYISEPEKVDAERRAMEEAAEAERKAIAKREAAKEKNARKPRKRNASRMRRTALSGRFSFSLSMTSGAEREKSAVTTMHPAPARRGKVLSVYMKASTPCTNSDGRILTARLCRATSIICRSTAIWRR